MIGDSHTTVLPITYPCFFLTKISNLTHYPRIYWVTVYILKVGLPASALIPSPIVFTALRIIFEYSDAKTWNWQKVNLASSGMKKKKTNCEKFQTPKCKMAISYPLTHIKAIDQKCSKSHHQDTHHITKNNYNF